MEPLTGKNRKILNAKSHMYVEMEKSYYMPNSNLNTDFINSMNIPISQNIYASNYCVSQT